MGRRRDAALLAISAMLYVGMVIVFTGLHILPLNAATEAWRPEALPADWSSERTRWNTANRWRALASLAAFCLAAWVLLRSACRGRT